MYAQQLEFPLEDCLSAEEKVNYLQKKVNDMEYSQDKVRKCIFAENSKRKTENKQIRLLLENLIDLLKRSQCEALELDASPENKPK